MAKKEEFVEEVVADEAEATEEAVATGTIVVRGDKQILGRFRTICTTQGLKPSDVVNQMVSEYVDDNLPALISALQK